MGDVRSKQGVNVKLYMAIMVLLVLFAFGLLKVELAVVLTLVGLIGTLCIVLYEMSLQYSGKSQYGSLWLYRFALSLSSFDKFRINGIKRLIVSLSNHKLITNNISEQHWVQSCFFQKGGNGVRKFRRHPYLITRIFFCRSGA